MNSEINSIWTDWRLKVPSGVPNPFNDYHLVLLKEVCFDHGIDQKIVDNVILVLEKDEKIDPDTPIKYKDKEGNQVETTYKKAIQRDKEHPARIEAEKLRKSGGKEEPEKEEPKASGMSTDDYVSTALTSAGSGSNATPIALACAIPRRSMTPSLCRTKWSGKSSATRRGRSAARLRPKPLCMVSRTRRNTT